MSTANASPSSPVCQYRFQNTRAYVRCAMRRGLAAPPGTVRRPSWFMRWVCGPLMVLFAILAIAAGVASWMNSGEFPGKELLGVLLLSILAVHVCWPWMWKPGTWSIFLFKGPVGPHADRVFVARVSNTGVELDDGILRATTVWQGFTRAKFFDDGILLESGPSVFTWLPDDGLEQGGRVQAEALVRNGVAEFYFMSSTAHSATWR